MASTPSSMAILETIIESRREEDERLRAEYTSEKVEKGFRVPQGSKCRHHHPVGSDGSPRTSPKRIRRAKVKQKSVIAENEKTEEMEAEKAPSTEKQLVLVATETRGPKVRPWSSVGERSRKGGRKSPPTLRPKSARPVAGNEVVRPWSATELVVATRDMDVMSEEGMEVNTESEKLDEKAKWVWTPKKKETEEKEVTPGVSPGPKLKRSVQSFQELLEGPQVADDEYDTDLEEDFPPEPEKEYDPSGTNVYLEQCKKEGLIPISYVLRHLKEPSMRMRHHYLGGKGTKPLAKALMNNPYIEELDLVDNHIEDEGTVALGTMMRENCSIAKLDIAENCIYSRGASAVLSMLETNYTLKTLSLRANHLTDSDARLLSEALKSNSTLTELDLSNNDFGEFAGVHLAPGLAENNGLVRLNLSWNAIRGKGSVALFNALKANSVLEMLDLSWNGIALPGCQALGRALKVNTTLRILNLSNNHINLESAKKLVIGLKKNLGLEVLMMGTNPLGEEGIMTLLTPMYKHRTLRVFTIQGLTVPTGIKAKIDDLMEAKDIYVLHAGVGGYKRQQISSSTVSMVDQFISENQLCVLDGFLQKDIDRVHAIAFDEVMDVLKENGLQISEEQINKMLTSTRLKRTAMINYRALLGGFSNLRSGMYADEY